MIPREPLTKALSEDKVASTTLRLLDYNWSLGDELLSELAEKFPEFHAAYAHWEKTTKAEDDAVEAVWQAREALLKVATDYTPAD